MGHGGNIIATAFDTKEVALQKYPDIQGNLDLLESSGAKVLFQVDGTKLEKVKMIKPLTFDFIVFMFPHVGRGIKDIERNIAANQKMISSFFSSAKACMSATTQIHVTLKQVEPYTLWKVKELAVDNALACVRSFEFDPATYPGYVHRRTLGFEPGLSREQNEELIGKGCRTFCFSFAGLKAKRRAKEESSDEE